MLSKEDFLMIKQLHERGVYKKDIAEELGVHPRTVSRALSRGRAPNTKRKHRRSKLDSLQGESRSFAFRRGVECGGVPARNLG